MGIITNENSAEELDIPLSTAPTYTYLVDGRKTWEKIGRGWWVSHNHRGQPHPGVHLQ